MRRVNLFALAAAMSMSSFATSDAMASDGLLDDSDSAERDRDTSRYSIALAGGHFAVSLDSYQDPGAAVVFGTPLWLSRRYASFQLQVGVTGLLGLATHSSTARLLAGPHFGFTKFWGHRYGLEYLIGPAAIAHLGRDSATGIGLFTTLHFVITPFDDDRKRISLGITAFDRGPSFGSDQTDTESGAWLWGLGYAAPF